MSNSPSSDKSGGSCGHRHAPGETCSHPDHHHPTGEGPSSAADHAHEQEHTHGHAGCCGHHDHHHAHGHDHHDGEEKEWTRRFLLGLELIVLLLWAVVLLYFYASGRVQMFLAPQFQPLTLIGGLGIAILGLYNWAMRAANAGCGHDHSHDECCGHDHGHTHTHDHDHDHAHAPAAAETATEPHHHHESGLTARAFGLIMLAFPVAAAAALTPDEFSPKYIMQREQAARNTPSAAAVRQRLGVADASKPMTGYTIDVFNRVTTRNPKGEYELRVDFLYDLAYDPEVRNVVKGIPVETTGMLTVDKVNNPEGKRLRAVIMITSCCAADGRPYSVPVEFDGPAPKIEEMTWYKVSGNLEFGSERGNPATVLKNPKITPTTRPSLFRMAY